jgi:hypothetical protein
MLKNKNRTIAVLLSIAMLLSISIAIQPSYALMSQNTQSWFTNSDTNVTATATGDVNGDGQVEIVTVGYYNDGTHWNAQLNIYNGLTLVLLNTKVWLLGTDAQFSSVAVANVTGKPALDIITGGSYFDGTRWVAMLTFFNGATLALESFKTWYVIGDTEISAVTAADLTGRSSALEIIVGGSYNDGTHRVAMLTFWNGATLNQDAVKTWNFGGDTVISSLAVANLTGRSALEVIAGGSYNDGTRLNAMLVFWNGATLAQDAVKTWYVVGDTQVSSVVAANVTGGTAFDIVVGGSYNDGIHRVAQLTLLDGAHLTTNSATHWFTTSDTQVNSVAVGNFGEGNHVVTAGCYYDNTRSNAQLVTWT